VVMLSMLLWLSTRKGIHNQASQPIAGKPGDRLNAHVGKQNEADHNSQRAL
jgi:hypothetical protein